MNVSACTEVDIILTDYAGVSLRFFWSEKNSDPNVASFSILYVIIVGTIYLLQWYINAKNYELSTGGNIRRGELYELKWIVLAYTMQKGSNENTNFSNSWITASIYIRKWDCKY